MRITPPQLTLAPLALAVLGLVACGDTPPEAPPEPPPPEHAAEMVLRVEGPIASLDGILEIVNARLAALEAGRAEAVPGDPPRIRCLVEEPWQDDPDAIEAVVTRAGTLEMRIVATEAEALAENEVREASGDEYRPTDPTYRWVAVAGDEADEMLVLLPEQRLVQAIRESIAQEGPQARERMDGLRAELDSVRASEVFTEQDVARAAAQSSPEGANVFFELSPERAVGFGDFTQRYVDRQLAIILDGVVQSAPVIRSPLPGKGVISGGPDGFTEADARDLASVLSGGRALPARLVRESFELVR